MKTDSVEIEPKKLDHDCRYCHKPLFGRSDKQFCNDKCRNCYHNKHKSKNRTVIKKVNVILKKNVAILEKLTNNTTDNILIQKSTLLSLGFDFTYLTHLGTNKVGETIYFCYDYGYYTNQDICIIVSSP